MRQTQQNARSDSTRELAFYWSRPILIVQLGVCLFFAILFGDMILLHTWLDDSSLEGAGRILIRVAWVASLLGLFAVMREFSGRPRLWTDHQGVWFHPNEANLPEYLVPWGSICDVELRIEKASESTEHWMEMRLHPERWNPPRDRFDPSVDSIPLGHLGGKPHEIVFAIRERWKRSRVV